MSAALYSRATVLVFTAALATSGCIDFGGAYDQYCVQRGDCDGGTQHGSDSGPPDSGPPDSGPPDSGPPDSGAIDSGHFDAGTDAGNPDSGSVDSGTLDAGDHCLDGMKNFDEGDIDCGGSCATDCGADGGCMLDSDCASGLCHSMRKHCATSACGDGRMNGQETDIDCGGGGSCVPCELYKACANAADCTSDNCSSNLCAPYPLEWDYGYPMLCSRRFTTAVAIAERVYIYGNTNTCDMSIMDPPTVVESSSDVSEPWVEEATMSTPTKEGSALLAVPGNLAYAVGGYNDNQLTARWETMRSAVPGAFKASVSMAARRAYFASTTLPDGRLFVAGGHNAPAGQPVNAINATEFFFPDAGAPDGGYWVVGAPLGTFRAGASAVVANGNRILVMGGKLQLEGSTALATIEQFPLDGGPPTSHSPMPIARALFGAANGADGRIYAVGGEIDGGPSARVDAFDPVANRWASVTPLPDPRKRLALVLGPDNRLWAIGGEGPGQSYSYQVYKYGPRLTAHPSTAARGTDVIIQGNGFPPTTLVHATLDSPTGPALASKVSDINGNLPNNATNGLTFKVPAGTASGVHHVYLRDVKSGYPVRVALTVP